MQAEREEPLFCATEVLIELVSEYPVLWNGAGDHEQLEKTWSSVAQRVAGESWASMAMEQREDLGDYLKQEWKSVQVQYKNKTSDFADILTFLDPFLDKTPKDNHEAIGTKSGVSEDSLSEFNKKRKLEEILETNESKPANANAPSAVDINKLYEMVSRAEQRDKKRFEDEDMLFLMSLLPSLKVMKPTNKLKAKVEILEVMKNNLRAQATLQHLVLPNPVVPTKSTSLTNNEFNEPINLDSDEEQCKESEEDFALPNNDSTRQEINYNLSSQNPNMKSEHEGVKTPSPEKCFNDL